MADTKISELTDSGGMADNSAIPIVDDTGAATPATRRVHGSDMRRYMFLGNAGDTGDAGDTGRVAMWVAGKHIEGGPLLPAGASAGEAGVLADTGTAQTLADKTLTGVASIGMAAGALADTGSPQTLDGKTLSAVSSITLFSGQLADTGSAQTLNSKILTNVSSIGMAAGALVDTGTAQSLNSKTITGGSINNTPIGATTPSSIASTTFDVTSLNGFSAIAELDANQSILIGSIRDSGGEIVSEINFQAHNFAGSDHIYVKMRASVGDGTTGQEDGTYQVFCSDSGSDLLTYTVGRGMYFPTASGGDKGQGTINAAAVYDDNVLLTCYPFDQKLDGAISDAKWDDKAPDIVREGLPAERRQKRVVRKIAKEKFVEESGKIKRIFETKDEEVPLFTDPLPVEDTGGQPVLEDYVTDSGKVARRQVFRVMPIMEDIPAGDDVIEPRIHEPMRKFRSRIGTEYDPLTLDGYAKHWKEKRHLTSMPNELGFDPVNDKLDIGSWTQRIIETVEIQAILIEDLNILVKELRTDVEDLKSKIA